jgi:ABC-type multidrug transport system fused ATPase/permease subunit
VVQQALNALMRGRTTIAVAHRLSTIENADVIYVVDGGRVVDQGKHEDLVGKDGLYRHLYELQFRDGGRASVDVD